MKNLTFLPYIGPKYVRPFIKNTIDYNMYHYIVPAVNEYRTVPLHIFQTWHTLRLPPFMSKCVNQLKQFNPEFTHHLYDDEMCKTFIREHFEADVVRAYDTFIPGAYKADLWRYCILYVYGGIYVDIKYQCVPPFKLIELTHQETYVRDREYAKIDGVYQALLVCYPKNPILYSCIRKMVAYAQENFYGQTCLFVGPHLVSSYFSKQDMAEMTLSFVGTGIDRHGKIILREYPEYRGEVAKYAKRKHYSELWLQRNIYAYTKLKPTTTTLLPIESVHDISSIPTGLWIQTNVKGSIRNHEWREPGPHLLKTSFEKCKFYMYRDTLYHVGLQHTNHGYRIFSGVYPTSQRIRPDFHKSIVSEMMWCMATFHEELCILYSFYPLVIGTIDYTKSTLSIRKIQYTPLWMKGLYTSTPSVPWKGTQWVLLYKPTSYIYQQQMHSKQEYVWIVLNESLEILKHSAFFTVEGSVWDLQFREDGIQMITSNKQKSLYSWTTIESLPWTHKELSRIIL